MDLPTIVKDVDHCWKEQQLLVEKETKSRSVSTAIAQFIVIGDSVRRSSGGVREAEICSPGKLSCDGLVIWVKRNRVWKMGEGESGLALVLGGCKADDVAQFQQSMSWTGIVEDLA
ncbi:hypothetical protein COLO4_19848 [Corchorus olitorius]|uniref:Uncharacterized protein n=1 Tax=Corchorus olitorius TaxID=93759 RepID=A0A1R3J316_9ROSI|nr:hypothetical protein COLO4_19848 [Corchorus olitorius]